MADRGQSLGLVRLIDDFGLDIAPPAVRSALGSTRRTDLRPDYVLETYPLKYACETTQEHLRFALRYEPIDLRIWHPLLKKLPPQALTDWIIAQPSSGYARRAWFLYEEFTGERLTLPDAPPLPYVAVANQSHQFVLKTRTSSRHRIHANLLGTAAYCPLVRQTPRLREFALQAFSDRAAKLAATEIEPAIFRRAAEYLYLSETRSSYQIEGERPSATREERFVNLLSHAERVDILGEKALTELQRQIVQDDRFAASGWRTKQVWVGRARADYSEDVRYPCPQPQSLPSLMQGWIAMVEKLLQADKADAVALAAAASFGFVYLHPFDDGNGRLHRFIVHHVLARLGYTPPGVIFPVSAAIARRLRDYESVLERVSAGIRRQVQFSLDDRNEMTVEGDTTDLYRYPDLTPHAEFLYECIQETVERDWPQEIRFIQSFDRAFRGAQERVDMPDKDIRLLIRLVRQNGGKLSAAKRDRFPKLTDREIESLETIVVEAFGEEPVS
ncbi:MAG: Fic family protein [Bryobacteraceae bacterium]|nr:Fic family protein [Bryobacteraceae bacterium]